MRTATVLRQISPFIFILVVFAPLGALVVYLAMSLHADYREWMDLIIPTGRRFALLGRSIGFSVCVAGGSIIVGLPAAVYLWQWNSGLIARFKWLVLALIAIPPYIHALGWSAAVNSFNGLLMGLGFATLPFQGWFASWWVELMALAPLAVGLSLIGLESIDPALMESARLMRTDFQCFTRIALPLAAPQILAGSGFVFLLSITDYSVPLLFQLNVYSLEIFAEYSATGEPVRSFLLAVPLLLITVLVLTFSQSALRNAVLKPPGRAGTTASRPEWPAWVAWSQNAGAALVALQIAVPLVMLVTTVGSWSTITGSLVSARSEILFTFIISVTSAMASLPLGYSAARKLLGNDRQGRLWWFLVTAPLAVPAPLVGIGLIGIWNRPEFGVVYGTCVMPVMASLSRFAPLAALAILAQLRRTDPLLIDAARVFHTSLPKTWLQVRIPMLLPGIMAAFFTVFVLSAGELGATLIVAPPGHSTLTIRIYNYLHYGASETVSGLCLAMAAVALLTGFLAVLVMKARRRPFARRLW